MFEMDQNGADPPNLFAGAAQRHGREDERSDVFLHEESGGWLHLGEEMEKPSAISRLGRCDMASQAYDMTNRHLCHRCAWFLHGIWRCSGWV